MGNIIKTGKGVIREIAMNALSLQSPIDRTTLYEHIADEMGSTLDTSFKMSISKSLDYMKRDGLITLDDHAVALLNGTPVPVKPPTIQRFVQINPNTDRAKISPFMLKRSPRNVTLESSPMLIEDILKVEFRFQGEVWIEIDSESGLRICLGETEAWWHPNELHHAARRARAGIQSRSDRRHHHTSDESGLTNARI